MNFPLQSNAARLKLIKCADGQATIEFEASGRHAHPMGTLHAGVLCDIADAAMAAYRSTLADGESFTTLELKINFYARVNAILRQPDRSPRQTVGSGGVRRFDERGRLVRAPPAPV